MKNIWIPLKDGKYIPDDQFPALEKQYNRFVAQLLSAAANPPAGNEQTASGTKAATIPPTAQQKESSLMQGRFSQKSMPDAEIWTITNLQISKGGSGAQTLITAKKPTGESVSGYIRGEAPLKTGQSICNLKLLKKNSPIVGDYNIVESYQMAA